MTRAKVQQHSMQRARLSGGTLAMGLGVVGLAIMPRIASTYVVGALTEMLILGLFAVSLGFLMGFPKLTSLGHAAFFGSGAYTAGIVATRFSSNLLVTLMAALAVSSLLALVIGALSLRSVGAYFLMITLALAQVVYVVAEQWVAVTGGSNGLVGIPPPELFGLIEFNRSALYRGVLLIVVAVLALLRVILRSPFGQVLAGIGSNEARLRAIGYPTWRYKLVAFVLAGALAGVAGALWAHYNGVVAPVDAHWSHSATAIIMVIVGGVGTLFGPLLGAALVWLLESELSAYTDRSTMITGILFVAFVLFARGGVLGAGRDLWRKVRR